MGGRRERMKDALYGIADLARLVLWEGEKGEGSVEFRDSCRSAHVNFSVENHLNSKLIVVSEKRAQFWKTDSVYPGWNCSFICHVTLLRSPSSDGMEWNISLHDIRVALVIFYQSRRFFKYDI